MTKVDVRLQRARRRLGGARVLAIKLRVEPFPTCRMRGLCDECQSRCGATPFEPRPVGTVPECVSPWRHTLDEDSPADENVSRAGDGCGERVEIHASCKIHASKRGRTNSGVFHNSHPGPCYTTRVLVPTACNASLPEHNFGLISNTAGLPTATRPLATTLKRKRDTSLGGK